MMTTHRTNSDVPPDDDPRLDVPLDATLRAAAQHYHAPPPSVPADAMWAAIQARRAEARPAQPAAPNARPEAPVLNIAHLPQNRSFQRRQAWRWAPLIAAATLLLGVGIGRYTAPTTGGAAGGNVATRGAPPAGGRGDAVAPLSAPDAASGAAQSATSDARSALSPGASRRPTGTPGAASVASADAPGINTPDANTPDSRASAGSSSPLRAVTEQHLARAEVLLTTVTAQDLRAEQGDSGAAVAPDAAWARELLTTTRLLLDSPAAREPARRALLEDLELVLGQIARLPRADTLEERALIDRAIRHGDLLAKLRTAVLAGAPTLAVVRGT